MFQHLRIVLPVLLLAGCGTSPSPSPSTPSTPAAPTPAVTSVTVSGAAPVVGESSQFTATATLSNGGTEEVTAQATWQSSDAGVVTVSSAGVVRSVGAGEADVTATYSGKTGSQRVRVEARREAARTVTGVVTDDATGLPVVEGAEAQVMDGDNAGMVGRVDGSGVYSISGLAPGTFMLRARANGYLSRDYRVTLDASDMRVDFALQAEARRPAPCSYTATPDSIVLPYVAGQFTATIRRSSGNCAWSATTDAGWIALFTTAGDGDGSLTFGYVANPTPETRNGTVRVNWSGGSVNLGVRQFGDRDPCVAGITVGAEAARLGGNSITVPASAGQFTASIVAVVGIGGACGPWTASAAPPDLASFAGSTSGVVPGTVTFAVPQNSTPLTRTVHIVINFAQGNPSAVLTVNQSAGR